MKFGQWGDSPAKEDGSFSFGPVNVVNSTAHTTPSTLIKQGETQLPRRAVAEVLLGGFFSGWGREVGRWRVWWKIVGEVLRQKKLKLGQEVKSEKIEGGSLL